MAATTKGHTMRGRMVIAIALAFGLVAVACGDSAETTTTTVGAGTGVPTSPPATTTPPPTSTATTAAPPATTVPATTTATAATSPTTAATTTTLAPTTTIAATTTTRPVPTGSAQSVVEAKTNAVVAALPRGWDGFVESGFNEEGDDVVFTPCLGPDDFDLDNLDASSEAALQVEITGPIDDSIFGPPEANIEARVFQSEAIATAAFAALEKTLGTEEGRECLGGELLDEMAGGMPEDAEFSISVEAFDVPGAGVAGRIILSISASGISADVYVELVASRSGPCTIFASFITFNGPFPPDVLAVLFGAALAA